MESFKGFMKTSRISADDLLAMLIDHAVAYATCIETDDIREDVKRTFGVKIDKPAVTYRLRQGVKRGLVVRVGDKLTGYWVFGPEAVKLIREKHPELEFTEPTRPPQLPRPVTKSERVGSGKKRKRGVTGPFKQQDRLDVEAFVAANKQPGEQLQFSWEDVRQFIGARRRVTKKRLRKALENMTARGKLQRGQKIGRYATYIVAANNDEFSGAAVTVRPAKAPKTRSLIKSSAARPDAARLLAAMTPAQQAAAVEAAVKFGGFVNAVVRCVSSFTE
jgi:hypothetical protein